ncbi:hypothetical protein ACTA71_007065 [Dictyostelium dimigraforme]
MNNPIIYNYKKSISLSFEDLLVNKDIDDSFFCPICLKIMIDARQGCSEGHVFCNSCITSWLKEKKNCPICRLYISPKYLSKNKYLESNIKRIEVYCPNKKDLNNVDDVDGCSQILEIGDVEYHSQKCIRRFVLCQYGGDKCGPVRLTKLLSHEIECPFVIVKCNKPFEIRNKLSLNIESKHRHLTKRKTLE